MQGFVRPLWGGLFLGVLLTVVYLSLRPSPAISTLPGVPAGWARWLDRHDVVKNALGFGCLGLTGFMGFRRRGVGGRANRRLLVLLAAFILALELTQIGTAARQAHWRDVLVGWASLGGAYALVSRLETGRLRNLGRPAREERAGSSPEARDR